MLTVKDLITKLLDFDMNAEIYLSYSRESILDGLNNLYQDEEGDIVLTSQTKRR
jgi:hypothetical protein